jgi:hypothetical protein
MRPALKSFKYTLYTLFRSEPAAFIDGLCCAQTFYRIEKLRVKTKSERNRPLSKGKRAAARAVLVDGFLKCNAAPNNARRFAGAGYFGGDVEVREGFGDGELLVFGVELIEAVAAAAPA